MSNYPIEQSSQIFFDVAKLFGEEPITTHDEIERLFSELQRRLGGWVILDFLDLSNWDRIEHYEIDQDSGILTLTWHDYRNKRERPDEKEMRQMVFPASVYACALQINSIVPIVGRSSALFLMNGFAKTEREIRNLYKPGADEFLLQDHSFFEKRVVRRASGHVEVIDFHCTPIFSMALVPKQSGLGSHHSKQILYSYNFRIAIQRIRKVVDALDNLAPTDHDAIAEKTNTVRRIMEFVLKVECCSRGLTVKKNYSQVRLGDLISTIKLMKEEHMQVVIGRFAEFANEFSHDSGKPTDMNKAKLVAMLALSYSSLIELEQRRSSA